jgi:hypothetical protein
MVSDMKTPCRQQTGACFPAIRHETGASGAYCPNLPPGGRLG